MKTDESRRKMFTDAGRWGLLALVGALVGKLGWNSLRSPAGTRPPSVCPGCPVLGTCTLPGAVRARGSAQTTPVAGGPNVTERPGLCGFQKRT